MRDRTLWTWHLFAGVVILVFLGLHMAIMHLDGTVRVFNPAPGEPIRFLIVTEAGDLTTARLWSRCSTP